MKKIFTLVMLSIFSVMYANATEETLWEGDVNISWEDPAPTGTVKEWGSYEDGQDISTHFVAGAKIHFYFKSEASASYHAYKFDDWDWASLPGQTQVDFGGDITVTLEVNEDIAKAVADKGFRIHGHGFHVVKVTKGEIESEGETVSDLEAALLWTGENEIDGWGGKVLVLTEDSDGFSLFTEKLTTACNLYFLIENATGGDFRISGQWGAWSATAFPSDGYNHMKAIDTDNVVKVTLTKDFVTEAFVKKGGIAFWGNGGFKIKAIGTTKGSVMGTTGIDVRGKVTVDSDNTAKIYDLQGRKVANPTKGLYITNGKKFSVK